MASLTVTGAAHSAEVLVFAAGSLRAPLVDMAKEWEADHPGDEVRFVFGASGLLKERLTKGERADLFASANMEHPQALHEAGLARPVQRFATNSMCALIRPGVDVTGDNLVSRMRSASETVRVVRHRRRPNRSWRSGPSPSGVNENCVWERRTGP